MQPLQFVQVWVPWRLHVMQDCFVALFACKIINFEMDFGVEFLFQYFIADIFA